MHQVVIYKNWPPVEFILQINRGQQITRAILLTVAAVSSLAQLATQLVILLADLSMSGLRTRRIGGVLVLTQLAQDCLRLTS